MKKAVIGKIKETSKSIQEEGRISILTSRKKSGKIKISCKWRNWSAHLNVYSSCPFHGEPRQG
jgi:hypothetical protein